MNARVIMLMCPSIMQKIRYQDYLLYVIDVWAACTPL